MKKSKKFVRMVFAFLFVFGGILLTGCGSEDDASEQADIEVQYEISEEQSQSLEEQTESEIVQTQDATREKEMETGLVVRAYSDKERERMAELQQSYDNETTKPEKMIQEVDSPEAATEGTPCYIRSTGEYYLPDRELTDEELLEIIDCDAKIAVNSQGWTQEKIDEENRRDRAIREEKIKSSGGISEEEAIEIARKAMEADIGEKAKELEVSISFDCERYGWKLSLYEDNGVVYYYVPFGNKEEVVDPEDFFNYNCSVNAIDGSIYEAYSLSGDVGLYPDMDDLVWYEH